MPRQPIIPSADLAALVAAGGATWRHQALTAALMKFYGCSERTARRTISHARAAGMISASNGAYQVAQPPSAPDSQPTRRPHPVRGSHITNSTGRRHRVDRLAFLELLRDHPMTYTEVIAATCARFGCSPTTARHNLRLALRYCYIQKHAGVYALTEDARLGLDSYGRLVGVTGARFARFCSGRPGRSLTATTRS